MCCAFPKTRVTVPMKDAILHVRTTQGCYKAWKKAAKAANVSLSRWTTETLNAKAGAQPERG